MKTLHYSLIIVFFMLAFFFAFYIENSHDVRATCVTINGTEECAPPPPLLNSIKSLYVPNETIQLVGVFSPNAMIQIDLVDPNDNIKNSVLVQSDSSGSFQSKMVVPNDAINGTWKINTSSGLNHGTFYITVISKNLLDNQTNPNHSIPVTLTQSPLKQFESGINAKDVECKEGLQLIIKAEDGSPACVKPESVSKLLIRSWAMLTLKDFGHNPGHSPVASATINDTSNLSSALMLNLSTSSQVIQPGQPIGITISVNNTLSRQVSIQDENSWKLNSLSLNPCTSTPYGIAIFDGFYSEQNMTQGKPLLIFSPDALCPVYNKTIQSYAFQPFSDHVTVNNCTDTPSSCSSGFGMGGQVSISGVWNSGQIEPLKSGLYTIVGGDEWGHVAIEHFVVTNSTIFAGDLGSMSCPLMYGGVQLGATIKNSTGFANYYNSTQYGHTFFFLHPKMQGTINVQYSAPANAAKLVVLP